MNSSGRHSVDRMGGVWAAGLASLFRTRFQVKYTIRRGPPRFRGNAAIRHIRERKNRVALPVDAGDARATVVARVSNETDWRSPALQLKSLRPSRTSLGYLSR